MANTPPEEQLSAAVEHFHDILIHCVQECADTRCGPYDVFLWNARRLAEAILYALAEGADVSKTTGRHHVPDLAALVKSLVHIKRLHDKVQYDFETLRSCGNIGAHTQHLDTEIDETTLAASVSSIVVVVEWFYRKSALARPMPTLVSRALVELKSTVPKPSRIARQKIELDQAVQERDTLRREVKNQRERMRELQRAFAGEEEELPTVTEIRALAGNEHKWPSRLGWTGLGVVVGALLVALGLGQPGSGQAVAASPPVALAAPARPAVDVVCPHPPACPASQEVCPPPPACPACPIAQEAAAAPAEAAAPPAVASAALKEAVAETLARATPTCPEGMLLVEGGTLRLASGPHPRENWPWPQPRPVPPPMPIETFCLDKSPVTARAYAENLPDACPLRGNANITGAQDFAANLVSRDCAIRYCEKLGGHLPSIAQWEGALRRHRKLKPAKGTWEMVADPFPFEVFGDTPGTRHHGYFVGPVGDNRPAGSPLLSWNIDARVAAGHQALSFRCATEPTTR